MVLRGKGRGDHKQQYVLFTKAGSIGGMSQLAYARPFLAYKLSSSVWLVSQCEVRCALSPTPFPNFSLFSHYAEQGA